MTERSEPCSHGDRAALRLIDCREQDEWDICHIDGAELMPLTRFGEEADGEAARHVSASSSTAITA